MKESTELDLLSEYLEELSAQLLNHDSLLWHHIEAELSRERRELGMDDPPNISPAHRRTIEYRSRRVKS